MHNRGDWPLADSVTALEKQCLQPLQPLDGRAVDWGGPLPHTGIDAYSDI